LLRHPADIAAGVVAKRRTDFSGEGSFRENRIW
jgi:hypothetical protein